MAEQEKRPSSLTVLEISRARLAELQSRSRPKFLPDRPKNTDDILQAIIELLKRLFHSFKLLEGGLRI